MPLAIAARMHAFTRPVPSPSSLAPSLLSIAGRVGHVFEIQTMLAGFGCHARGVSLEGGDGRSAHATVKGKRSYTVNFRVADAKLLVKCSCPAESMGVTPCKHAWAALLEIDRQGALADLRTNRGMLTLEREIESEAAPVVEKTASTKSPAKAKAKKATAATPPPPPPKKKTRR